MSEKLPGKFQKIKKALGINRPPAPKEFQSNTKEGDKNELSETIDKINETEQEVPLIMDESINDGTARTLISFALDEELSSNPFIGSVSAVLIQNNGSASVQEIAQITEQTDQDISNLGQLSGVFELFPDPETNQPILSSPALEGIQIVHFKGNDIVTFNPEEFKNEAASNENSTSSPVN